MPAGSKATVPASGACPKVMREQHRVPGARGKAGTQRLCKGEVGREAGPRMGVWGPAAGPGSGKAQARPRQQPRRLRRTGKEHGLVMQPNDQLPISSRSLGHAPAPGGTYWARTHSRPGHCAGDLTVRGAPCWEGETYPGGGLH